MSIAEKALLVNLTIGLPPASKKVKGASEQIETEKLTAKNQASVVSRLFARQDVQELSRVATEARKRFHELVLPYGRSAGLVPTARYFDFMEEIGQFRRQFEAEKQDLLSNFKQALDNAAEANGKLFDINNYPSYAEMEDRIFFSIEITPVPTGNEYDQLADLTPEQIENLKREAIITNQSKAEDAMKALYDRLFKTVKHVGERLTDEETGDQKVFRDTLLTNLEKALEAAETLNITDDNDLKQLAQEVREVIAGVTANDLRRDAELRRETATKAKDIATRIGELF